MTRKYEYNKANLITGVTNINNKNVKTSYRYSYYPDGNIAHGGNACRTDRFVSGSLLGCYS